MTGLSLRKLPRAAPHRALLDCGGRQFPCSIGRSAITVFKREGDGATPAGVHRIIGGYFRQDRIARSRDSFWLQAIPANLGWCDDPLEANYNRPVRLPYAASHEDMRRVDHQYDVCLVLDWNFAHRARNRGSAIFLHLVSEQNGPTEGCVAVAPNAMRFLLTRIRPGGLISIHP